MLLFLLTACGSKDDGSPAGKGPGGDDTAPQSLTPLLVPLPTLLVPGAGTWTLPQDARIAAPGEAAAVGERLAAELRPATGYALPVVDSDGDIELRLDPAAGLADEGYVLDVTESGVLLVAGDTDGLYWGTQTFRQLLPPESLADGPVEGMEWVAPCGHVEDAPRFEWRGGMIDVARHFFDVEVIERQVDLYAFHKLNRLHLHLTDDQGWRIEIESWPDLTRIGGSTEVGGGEGGWYTQEEFVALAEYAAERHVTLVPEIDFPGHSHAALASYGELNESGVPEELYTGEYVITTPLWLDGEVTWEFVEDVWTEVAAITPGPWVHVGGDEAIDASEAEYTGFMQWVQGLVEAEGKTLVGWDEVGTADLSAGFLAQYWYDATNARMAYADGGRIIASPAEHCYLDMAHDASATYGQTWAGYVDVEASYDWDPVLTGLREGDVAGVEGPLWTELVETEEQVDFMTWPRLAALAEVGWTAEDLRSWPEFRVRLAAHGARLDALGVGYYASPEIDWSP